MKTRLLLPVLAVITLGAVACGGDEESITITDPWARTSPAMVTMGAAYMQIAASAGDTLIGVSVPSSIAERAEIHEMAPVAATDDSMDMSSDDSMDMDSMDMESMDEVMVMQQIMSLELPAGETVELKPGGYHVMLIGLAAPLEIGETFDLTLDFENAEDQVVTVEVREG